MVKPTGTAGKPAECWRYLNPDAPGWTAPDNLMGDEADAWSPRTGEAGRAGREDEVRRQREDRERRAAEFSGRYPNSPIANRSPQDHDAARFAAAEEPASA